MGENRESRLEMVNSIWPNEIMYLVLLGILWVDAGGQMSKALFSSCTQPRGYRPQATHKSNVTE